MNCAYHSTEEAQELCSTCKKTLCTSCAHQIKGKCVCQDCLVRGAEWASAMKDFRVPADAPKRAALCALVPGMGAVYNSDYMKGLTYFAVFASLVIMSDRVHEVFGFGAFAFLVFTMFEAYRSAEARARMRLEARDSLLEPEKDRSVMLWGIFLIGLGFLFLLQNIIPFYFLNRLWPLVFIFVGAYLVFYYMKGAGNKDSGTSRATGNTSDIL
ncbi:MAG: DUF5668 domain-containing protein [Acidobacteriota bacterium]